MALVRIVTLGNMVIGNVNQLIDLLTGVMTDQPVTIGNTLAAKTVGATGKASLASAATTNFVGRWTTTGAPTGLTGAVGDFGIDGGNTWWYCTVAGPPGTWIQMSPPPNTLAGNIVALGAAAAAGASGLSADASHVHPNTGLGVLATARTWTADQDFGTHLLGTLQTAAQPNVTSLGILTVLEVSGVLHADSYVSVGPSVPFTPNTGDLVANRGGASPGTGAVFFGSSAAGHYITYNGADFFFTDRIASGNGVIGPSSRPYVAADSAGGAPNVNQRLNGNFTGGGGSSSDMTVSSGASQNYIVGATGSTGSTATIGIEAPSSTVLRIRYGLTMGNTWGIQYGN